MSFPRMLTKTEILDKVKSKLAENSNFEIVQQLPYFPKPTGLPTLKTLSFILYKDVSENTYKVAQTTNLEIKHLSVEEFKQINQEELAPHSIDDYQKLCSKIDDLTSVKKKIKP